MLHLWGTAVRGPVRVQHTQSLAPQQFLIVNNLSMNQQQADTNCCRSSRRRLRLRSRRGIATVELAICLPVLSLIVFGAIQATNLIFLQHAVTAAAYEGALELAKPNATNSSVQTRIQQVLDAREVTGSTISILPGGTNVQQTPPGTIVTLEVTTGTTSNMPYSGFFIMPSQVTGRLVATR